MLPIRKLMYRHDLNLNARAPCSNNCYQWRILLYLSSLTCTTIFFSFIYLFLFLTVLGLLCCIGFSLVGCAGFSWQRLLLLHRLQGMWLQQLWRWAQELRFLGSKAQGQLLWPTGLIAPWHVGFSQIRDRTCVFCIGKWIFNH